VVIRVYSGHLTVAGEASLRGATHLERFPKTLTLAAHRLDRALFAGRRVRESGGLRAARQRGAIDPESSHLKYFRRFSLDLVQTLGAYRRTAASSADLAIATVVCNSREIGEGRSESVDQFPAG
jgi:hypothetical protein